MSSDAPANAASRAIGLTGGIATGKTTVAHHLETTYGLPIFDADAIAREAVAPGSAILQRIVERHGRAMLQPDGSLDRSQLGQVVFDRPSERRWLEAQIHPVVRERLAAAVREATGTVVLVVPLLFEAKMTDLVTEVWVVRCTLQQQRDRLMERNGYDERQADARIAAQMPLEQKCQQADVVLDNSGVAAVWQAQVRDRLA